jgi:uncharacterized membrane protein YbhN (UPF0104 family)
MSYWGIWIRSVLGLLLGIAAAGIVVLYFGISQGDVVAVLRDTRPQPLLFALLGALVLLGLQSLRWWFVMRPVLHLGYAQALKAMMVGFLFNALLPVRGGDLLRVQYLGRKTGVSRAKLLGTEIVDFWSDKWGWIAAFPMVCLAGSPPAWLYRALLSMGGILAAVTVVLALMGGSRHLRRGPRWLNNLSDGFAANHWQRLLLVETLIAPLPWLWETFVIMIAGHAFDLNITIIQAFATLTAFNIAMAIPSPANAGSFEAGGTLALIASGVHKDTALAFIFIYHMTQLVPGFVGGIFVLTLEGEALFGRRTRVADHRKGSGSEPSSNFSESATG